MLHEYNNKLHRNFGIKPVEVNKENYQILLEIVYKTEYKHVKRMYNISDYFRTSKSKGIFEIGYTASWSRELLAISEVIFSNPLTYRMKNVNNEKLKETSYQPELLKTKHKN